MKLSPTRAITGSVIALLGAFLLLDTLNLFSFDIAWRTWWPLLLIGGGLLMYMNDRSNGWWSGLLIGGGFLFLLKTLGIISINPWQLFWPIVLIVIGLSILTNRGSGGHTVSKADREDHSAIMGASDARVTSANFQGSKLTAVMGGVKLDLTKATIQKEATVEIFGFWGGVEIIVPENVVIKNQLSAVMAGVENKAKQDTSDTSPVLYITGDLIMSGAEIKNQA
jgi:predicted membrane protein